MRKKTESKTRLVRDPVFPNRYTVEHAGMVGSVEDWAKRLGIRKTTLYGRIRNMTLEKALTPGNLNAAVHNEVTHTRNQGPRKRLRHAEPMEAPNRFNAGKWFLLEGGKPGFQYKGSIKTIDAWAKSTGMTKKELEARLLVQKMTINMALAKVIRHGSPVAYDSLKCRCEVCCEANTKRHRELQQRKKAQQIK